MRFNSNLQLRLGNAIVELRMRESVIADLVAQCVFALHDLRLLDSPILRSRKMSPAPCFCFRMSRILRRPFADRGRRRNVSATFFGAAPICWMRQESG